MGEHQPPLRPVQPTRCGRWTSCSTALPNGRVIKCLVIVGDATHEALAIDVERAIPRHGVTRVLDRLAHSRGLPRVICTDNGKEFCGRAMVAWAGRAVTTDPTAQAEPERLRRQTRRSFALKTNVPTPLNHLSRQSRFGERRSCVGRQHATCSHARCDGRRKRRPSHCTLLKPHHFAALAFITALRLASRYCAGSRMPVVWHCPVVWPRLTPPGSCALTCSTVPSSGSFSTRSEAALQ